MPLNTPTCRGRQAVARSEKNVRPVGPATQPARQQERERESASTSPASCGPRRFDNNFHLVSPRDIRTTDREGKRERKRRSFFLLSFFFSPSFWLLVLYARGKRV